MTHIKPIIIPVDQLDIGDYLTAEDKFVAELSYKANHMVARLSFTEGTYPATSLLLDYDEVVEVLRA